MKDQKKSDKLKEPEKQAQEYLNGWKRAKADLINYKKEVEQRQSELREFMAADLILDILPIHDHFKKALDYLPSLRSLTIEQYNNNSTTKDLGTWIEGVKHIKTQLDKFLKDRGVEEIKTIGEKFNPEFHEAVSKRQVEDSESDIILEEVSSGYTMNGRVIMPAKVIISS